MVLKLFLFSLIFFLLAVWSPLAFSFVEPGAKKLQLSSSSFEHGVHLNAPEPSFKPVTFRPTISAQAVSPTVLPSNSSGTIVTINAVFRIDGIETTSFNNESFKVILQETMENVMPVNTTITTNSYTVIVGVSSNIKEDKLIMDQERRKLLRNNNIEKSSLSTIFSILFDCNFGFNMIDFPTIDDEESVVIQEKNYIKQSVSNGTFTSFLRKLAILEGVSSLQSAVISNVNVTTATTNDGVDNDAKGHDFIHLKTWQVAVLVIVLFIVGFMFFEKLWRDASNHNNK